MYDSPSLEARVGIEPTNAAFAEPCLTTWLPRRPANPQNLPAPRPRFQSISPILARIGAHLDCPGARPSGRFSIQTVLMKRLICRLRNSEAA